MSWCYVRSDDGDQSPMYSISCRLRACTAAAVQRPNRGRRAAAEWFKWCESESDVCDPCHRTARFGECRCMRAVCTDNRAFLGIKMYSNGTQDVHVCNYAIDKVVRPMLQRHLPFGPATPVPLSPACSLTFFATLTRRLRPHEMSRRACSWRPIRWTPTSSTASAETSAQSSVRRATSVVAKPQAERHPIPAGRWASKPSGPLD